MLFICSVFICDFTAFRTHHGIMASFPTVRAKKGRQSFTIHCLDGTTRARHRSKFRKRTTQYGGSAHLQTAHGSTFNWHDASAPRNPRLEKFSLIPFGCITVAFYNLYKTSGYTHSIYCWPGKICKVTGAASRLP
jgi:hypothetical protein